MRDRKQAKATIKFILNFMGKNTPYASELIYEVMTVESGKFLHNKQIKMVFPNGGVGYIQMEMNTYYDIIDNYLKFKPELMRCFKKIRNNDLPADWDLRTSIALQIFMCRCHFLRVKEPIPNNKSARAGYWKKYYNTEKGRGTIEHYLKLNR